MMATAPRLSSTSTFAPRPIGALPGTESAWTESAQGSARRALLGQIGRLERGLVEQRCSSWLRIAREGAAAARHRGPRLLSMGELEALRDDLVATLSAERGALADRTLAEDQGRRLREELMLDPAAHGGARVRNADIAEGGCGEVRSEPVCALLGMLMGWWRVIVSSGCP